MPTDQLLVELGDYIWTLAALSGPLLVAFTLAFLLSVRTVAPADLGKLARAVFSYLMMLVAVILMSTAAIVTALAAMTASALNDPAVHLVLLLLFAAGGILFLWVDQSVRHMDKYITRIPSLLYDFTLRIVCYVAIVFSILYLLLMSAFIQTEGWWKVPGVILLYSCLVVWLLLTGEETPNRFRLLPRRAGSKRGSKRRKK
ncbi:MAG TPA: hypothetical protein VI913_04150 [Candidatus Peribacteraceae bacterium]|nr:hypothetical protein [Candidatus Peribacteraceae bacterium]